ncbi:regulator of microtubule dynamics protein 1-like isoform X2 [Copidosoma floridanum]|uniref:regulator of microtubule dynamics protein 1-like isoform X2 n=1 Tax=Copidosoma floridanum TaxID=29053 RepID=UPI0006C98708|nr:regulator of microtubule dynamics protein 1-like isoform X2 [Copidosoma floridanum]
MRQCHAKSHLRITKLAQQINLQKSRRKKIIRRKIYSDDTASLGTEEVDIDTFSTAGTDIGDDEFFDCSDDEEEIANGEIDGVMNPELLELDKESEDTSLQPHVYIKTKSLLQENPRDVEIVWRFARACYHCSLLEPKKHKEYILEGVELCEKFLHIRDGNLYKWYAILIGVKSKFLPSKEKIKSGYVFREYVEKAIEIMPNDNYLHHLMGRFQYEVSELSWFEKKIASALFAEVPKGTYEDAIPFFEAAEKLSPKPHWENKLYLGKSYIAVGKPNEAVRWLNQLKDLPVRTEEDKDVRAEAQSLLKKYSEYCT